MEEEIAQTYYEESISKNIPLIKQIRRLHEISQDKHLNGDPVWTYYTRAKEILEQKLREQNKLSIRNKNGYTQTKTSKLYLDWLSKYIIPILDVKMTDFKFDKHIYAILYDSYKSLTKKSLYEHKKGEIDIIKPFRSYVKMIKEQKYIASFQEVYENDVIDKYVLKFNKINYQKSIFDQSVSDVIINQKLNLLHLKHGKKYPVCENFVKLEQVVVQQSTVKNFRDDDYIVEKLEFLEDILDDKDNKYEIKNMDNYLTDIKVRFLQLIYALKCAKSWFGFKHYDLHTGNWIRVPLDNKKLAIITPDAKFHIPNCYFLLKILDFDYSTIFKSELLKDNLKEEDKDEYLKYDVIKRALASDKNKSNMYRAIVPREARPYQECSDIIYYFFMCLRKDETLRMIMANETPSEKEKELQDFVYDGLYGNRDVAKSIFKLFRFQCDDKNVEFSISDMNKFYKVEPFDWYEKQGYRKKRKLSLDTFWFASMGWFQSNVKSGPFTLSANPKSEDELLQMKYFDEFRIKGDYELNSDTKIFEYQERPKQIDQKELKNAFPLLFS